MTSTPSPEDDDRLDPIDLPSSRAQRGDLGRLVDVLASRSDEQVIAAFRQVYGFLAPTVEPQVGDDPGHDTSLDVSDDSDPEPPTAGGSGGAAAPPEVQYIVDPEHPQTRKTRNGLAIALASVYLVGIVVWIIAGLAGADAERTSQVAAALVALGPFAGAAVAWYFPGRSADEG